MRDLNPEFYKRIIRVLSQVFGELVSSRSVAFRLGRDKVAFFAKKKGAKFLISRIFQHALSTPESV